MAVPALLLTLRVVPSADVDSSEPRPRAPCSDAMIKGA